MDQDFDLAPHASDIQCVPFLSAQGVFQMIEDRPDLIRQSQLADVRNNAIEQIQDLRKVCPRAALMDSETYKKACVALAEAVVELSDMELEWYASQKAKRS